MRSTTPKTDSLYFRAASLGVIGVLLAVSSGASAWAGGLTGCGALGGAIGNLRAALKTAQAGANGGLSNQMWGTLVARDGTVCAVAFSGTGNGAQWLLSRAISHKRRIQPMA